MSIQRAPKARCDGPKPRRHIENIVHTELIQHSSRSKDQLSLQNFVKNRCRCKVDIRALQEQCRQKSWWRLRLSPRTSTLFHFFHHSFLQDIVELSSLKSIPNIIA